MEEKRIQAIPRHGTWEALYERVRNYDAIWEAKKRKFLSIEARITEEGNLYLEECVEQDFGDEDGFGVEPDTYMSGLIDSDGYFIEPFHV